MPTYDCGLDWNGNGRVVGDSEDLRLCFDAATAAAGFANDGTDHSVVILIPDGTYDLSTGGWRLPYVLPGGVTIRGAFPRLKWMRYSLCSDCGEPPDLDMIPDGGTWLNVNDRTKVLFTTQKARGIVIENIGAENFGTFFTAGGDNVDGASFTRFTNLYLLGVPPSVDNQNNLVGLECYNCQHNYMDHINLYRLDTGIHWVAQNCSWQPSNSVWSDIWMVTRRATTSPGFWFQALRATRNTENCGSELAQGLNYITMIRPHVSAFTHGGLPGSTAFRFGGFGASVYGFTLVGIDLEGSSENGILAEGNVQSVDLNFAGCTGNTTNADVKFAGVEAQFNTIDSRCTALKVYTDSSLNTVSGQISRILPGSQKPNGLYRTYADGNFYQSAGFATFSPYKTVITGVGTQYGVDVNPFFGSADTVQRPRFLGIAGRPVLGLLTSGSHADLVGIQASPGVGGPATNGDVQRVLGLMSNPRVDPTGTGTTVSALGGLWTAPELGGSNFRLSELSYIRADSTLARFLPPGVSVTNVFGLYLPDLGSQVGFLSRDVIRIDAQTGQADGSNNNVRLYGGDWNSGHFRLGTGHLWYDDTFNRFRISEGAPKSASDGQAVVTGSGKDRYGVLLWADPATSEFDNGTAVCVAQGLTCVGTSDFASMTVPVSCGTHHSNGIFAVRCK